MPPYAIVLLVLLAVVVLFALSLRWFTEATVRAVFRPLLALLYRKRVVGLENFPRQGGAVVVCNHVSWIDGILLLWMLPRGVRFIVDGGNFSHRLLQFISDAFGTILMYRNPKSIARALRAGREALKAGDVVGLFPEGTLSRNAQFQAFRPGLGKLLTDRSGPVVPLWLDGMWGSLFSYSGGRFFLKWPQRPRRQLTLYIGTPLEPDTPVPVIRNRVAEMGAHAMRESAASKMILPRRVLRQWKRRGNRLKAADSTGVETTGRALLLRTLALRRLMRRALLDADERFVGILLPPSVAATAVNVAVALDRRVSVNLNYTVSSAVLNQCIATAGIRRVLTSRRFMEKFDFQLDAEIVYLEDVRDQVSRGDKIAAALGCYAVPAWLLERTLGLHRVAADDLLTVIFTSGSTGTPKGVMLSYANVGHNVDAIDQVVRLQDDDVVLGILPFFHSFGYSVTLWAVMTLKPAGVYHFNPLDARNVGKLADRYGATVLLGTPTFLRGYLRRVPPDHFKTLDVVVAGAEKMPRELFEEFEQRFGVRPVEGYGATELSPLVSVNVPPTRSVARHQVDRREGSVGRPVPGVAARIVSAEDETPLGVDEDGMLWITGPNVMLGYMGREDQTAEVLRDGWYVTGDIAHLDADGFIHITGRLNRFSKIGGEMVPHLRVEEELERLLGPPEPSETDAETGQEAVRLCVTSVSDPRKGERLIVLHRGMKESPESLRRGLAEAGLPNLYIPSEGSFIEVDEIPLLGTGKLDLKGIQELAQKMVQRHGESAGEEPGGQEAAEEASGGGESAERQGRDS